MFKRSIEKLYRETYYQIMSIKGHYSLTLDGQTATFSAPNSIMVRRNRSRFLSEKRELRGFIREVRSNDVVYDIGANTGLYSLFAANKCTDGEVVAFEPYPPNVELLKQDVSRNGLQNVTIAKVALSDSVGTIEFNQPKEDDVGFGSSVIGTNGSESTTTAPTTTGDQLIADNKSPQPNVVKIDVEGAEPLVIKGLEHALSSSNCRAVYCEVHLPGVGDRPSVEDFGSTPDEIQKRLESFGFTVEKLYTPRDHEVFYKAYK